MLVRGLEVEVMERSEGFEYRGRAVGQQANLVLWLDLDVEGGDPLPDARLGLENVQRKPFGRILERVVLVREFLLAGGSRCAARRRGSSCEGVCLRPPTGIPDLRRAFDADVWVQLLRKIPLSLVGCSR